MINQDKRNISDGQKIETIVNYFLPCAFCRVARTEGRSPGNIADKLLDSLIPLCLPSFVGPSRLCTVRGNCHIFYNEYFLKF